VPDVDRTALRRGALVAIAICLPVAVLTAALIDPDDPSAAAPFLYLAILIGFVMAGRAGSRAAAHAPLVTGGLAALAGYAVVELIGVVIRIASGDGVSVASVVLSGALAYGCGLTGAVLAERRRARG
jgi:hypothetical protein